MKSRLNHMLSVQAENSKQQTLLILREGRNEATDRSMTNSDILQTLIQLDIALLVCC